ncbi:alpha-amylase [Escherichia coli]|uniref:Alpha-amylase n=1 Tax=Escherichia coli TaxID=562 RepID=A0A377CEN7_ECOLX|nr:alpha-amylase [Escherichia coli]
MVWLPPAYKGASGGYSVGYDSYDLFDLGEFDQKGSIPTKYGDKAQLLAAIDALKRNDIAVLLDVVVNHKMGADEKEAIRVQRVNADDVRKLTKKSLSAKAGRVTPSPPVPGNTRSLSGISNVLAVSTISKILMKMAYLKLLTTTPAKAGTIRLMMNSVISII